MAVNTHAFISPVVTLAGKDGILTVSTFRKHTAGRNDTPQVMLLMLEPTNTEAKD